MCLFCPPTFHNLTITMSLEFLHKYRAHRLDSYGAQPLLLDQPGGKENGQRSGLNVILDFERNPDDWQPIDLSHLNDWQPQQWPERPIRFVDGKDVGQTIGTIRSPKGPLSPIRLAQIGGVAMRVEDGECRREHYEAAAYVCVIEDLFPSEDVAHLAVQLEKHGFHLLRASGRDASPDYDFERLRHAADNRTKEAMTEVEERVVARAAEVPTIADGLLEPRIRHLEAAQSPVFGVIKTHYRNYLHPLGLQVLYQLEAGQRTPAFVLASEKSPHLISWYVRLAGGGDSFPNYGVVRVEIAKAWYEAQAHDTEFIDRLSRTIYVYRSREGSYDRSAISLHPIVRAEESLGAIMRRTGMLMNRFYRLAGL